MVLMVSGKREGCWIGQQVLRPDAASQEEDSRPSTEISREYVTQMMYSRVRKGSNGDCLLHG